MNLFITLFLILSFLLYFLYITGSCKFPHNYFSFKFILNLCILFCEKYEKYVRIIFFSLILFVFRLVLWDRVGLCGYLWNAKHEEYFWKIFKLFFMTSIEICWNWNFYSNSLKKISTPIQANKWNSHRTNIK